MAHELRGPISSKPECVLPHNLAFAEWLRDSVLSSARSAVEKARSGAQAIRISMRIPQSVGDVRRMALVT